MILGRGNPHMVGGCSTASSLLGATCDTEESPIRPSDSSCAEQAQPISTGTNRDQASLFAQAEHQSGRSLRQG